MNKATTVDLDPLVGPQGLAWDALLELAPAFNTGWTLIGGQMVALHQAERQPSRIPGITRPSIDVDVIVNIRLGKTPAAIVDKALLRAGFEQVTSGVEHRYIRDSDGIMFDVLAPDNIGIHLPRLGRGHTLTAAGGSQALRRTSWVTAQRGQLQVPIPRPSLVGALLIKISASMGPASRKGPGRHYEDIISLSTMLTDEDARSAALTAKERKRIRRAADRIEKDNAGEPEELVAERLRGLLEPPKERREPAPGLTMSHDEILESAPSPGGSVSADSKGRHRPRCNAPMKQVSGRCILPKGHGGGCRSK